MFVEFDTAPSAVAATLAGALLLAAAAYLERDAVLVRAGAGALAPPFAGESRGDEHESAADASVAARVRRAAARALGPAAGAAVRFVSVLPARCDAADGGAAGGGARFAADAAPRALRFVWLFAVEVDDSVPVPAGCEWLQVARAAARAYDAGADERLAAPLRFFARTTFAPCLRDAVRLVAKRSAALVPEPDRCALGDARDFALLDSVFYTFDRPGKGVRSRLVRALAQPFFVPVPTLDRLCEFVEQFHQLSLMIDDIQDGSELRREQPCAYRLFGTPETLGSAYLQLFRLLADVPRSFPVRSSLVTELVVDGCRACQRGQALEVTWRERGYCPSVPEWTEMARGKTAAPFELAARLVFLQSNTASRLRLLAHRCVTAVTSRALRNAVCDRVPLLSPMRHDDVEEAIVSLCGEFGVYFQIRDDYINLASADYWALKGKADDLHEKKFSYPLVVMIGERLAGYKQLLTIYANAGERLTPGEIDEALELVKASGALARTRQRLEQMRERLIGDAQDLTVGSVGGLVAKLVIPPQTC